MSEGGITRVPDDASALRERVRCTLSRLSRTGELPSVPAVATSALATARNPDADVDELCRIVQTDVGIAARVLRVANSAVYARRTTCRTLRDAVTTIGFRAMQDVLIAASLRSLYAARNAVARGLWEHALAVGLACQELAPVLGGLQPGAVFLPGLFHDVGRIAFLVSDPEAFAVIAELVETGKHERLTLEQEWFGFDHAEVGATLAVDWGLAPDACDAIRWHHDPARAGVGRPLAELLHLSDRLANGAGRGTAVEPPPARPELSAEVLAASWERARGAFAEQRRLFE